MTPCSNCRAPLESPLACGACGRLQALDREPSPFEVLGLEPSHAVDPQDLRRRVLKLGRLVHPDYFATAGEEERERAEHATALVNGAHEILADEARRADWIVNSLGGPDENEERAMPQAFLAEVLEWNETLEEARRRPEASTAGLEDELRGRRRAALSGVSVLLSPLPGRGSANLRDARRELNAVRYVDRALAEIESLRLSRAETRAG